MKIVTVALLVLFISCKQNSKKNLEVEFVLNGIAVKTDQDRVEILSNGESIQEKSYRLGNYLFTEVEWAQNSSYKISTTTNMVEVQSPTEASPLKIAEILLDDLKLSPEGNFPDVDISISSDNELIAVGTYYGFIQVYSLRENKLLWKKKIAEGMVKKCIFSADSKQVFVGEQSIDANIYAFNARNGDLIWSKNLSLDIDQSPPPKGDNPYFIYSLPGVFHMALNQNNLIISAVHSWRIDGKQFKKSKIYSFTPNGQTNWTFPKKEPLNANIKFFDISRKYLTFNVDSFDDRKKAGPVKENSINLIDINDGDFLDSKSIETLKPYFNSVFFWQNVSISTDDKFCSMASLDGRAFIFPIRNNKLSEAIIKNPGQPIQVNDIPLAAGIPYTETFQNHLLLSLTETSIPYTYSSANQIYQPPALHPMSGHIIALDSVGNVSWDYYDRSIYSALSVNKTEDLLIAVVDDKKENRELGFFGFTLFKKDENSFLKRIYRYRTQSPVFFRGTISEDGQIKAVAQAPFKNDDSTIIQPDYKIDLVL